MEVGTSGRATPVSWAHVILVHSQPAPAVFVLSDLQLSTLLRRFTSEAVSCYLGHFNKRPSISMRKIQKATNVQAAPIQVLTLRVPSQLHDLCMSKLKPREG